MIRPSGWWAGRPAKPQPNQQQRERSPTATGMSRFQGGKGQDDFVPGNRQRQLCPHGR